MGLTTVTMSRAESDLSSIKGRAARGAFPLIFLGRMLPMGRILRVEPFCFARKVVSPMVDCSLPFSLGGLWVLGEHGTKPLPHSRCRRLSVSTLLTLSVQYKYCTDN